MSPNLSFREFIERVESRVDGYSIETLREIVLDWAKHTPPKKRHDFLDKLVPPASSPHPVSATDLLDEIDALATRVRNGDYCTGWGWDDAIQEERDWGDESWTYEMDALFAEAREALINERPELAEEAYMALFDILEMGDEPGHLPGSRDPRDILDTDLEETRLLYLQAAYRSAEPDARPFALLQAIDRFGYSVGADLDLRRVAGAAPGPLPDLADFLPNWIDLLRSRNDRVGRYLLREAVTLSGGTSAVAALAREEGDDHPEAYVDWIGCLEEESDFEAMAEAAAEGLARVPEDFVVRADIATGLMRAGKRLGDVSMQLTGCREAFRSRPSLSDLLRLLSLAELQGRHADESAQAIVRVRSLSEEQERSPRGFVREDRETPRSWAPDGLLPQAYLLSGRYEDAFELCDDDSPLGWSYGGNPKGLVIPFFLMLLSCEPDSAIPVALERLWEPAMRTTWQRSVGEDVASRFRIAAMEIIRSIQLSEDEATKYLLWCVEQTGKRVDAIVGKKHRGSYGKAADLLVATAEVLAKKKARSDGDALIATYRELYSRFSAFQRELRRALQGSTLL
ncbi:MAG: hypothetical protein Q8K99_04355, partial [Actinomycetota bacterium]|nr:hypothetical protein [Actinomycetota bacterium]